MAFGRRAGLTTALVAVMALLGMSTATAEVTPVKILGGSTDQTGPAANATYLGFTANTTDVAEHFDAFFKPIAGGPTIMLNTRGSGWFGGIRSDTNEAIYQQYKSTKGISDLHVIDLDTMTRTSPGSGVNSAYWEYDPSISPDFLLFGRIKGSVEQLILYDRTQGTRRLLDSTPVPGNTFIRPGTLTEQYATWTKCGKTSCNVFYWDVVAKAQGRVPNPDHHYFYYGSASDTSQKLYFVRSGNGCGVRTKIQSWNIGTTDPFTTVVSLPSGYDVTTRTFTFVDSGPHDNVYYDQLRCSGKYYADIYEAPSAEAA